MSRGKTNFKIITIFLGILLIILFSTPLRTVAEIGGDIINMDTSLTIPENLISSGSATYKIPIEIPPGRLGMTPRLEMLYNSSNQNGWLGVGWMLDMGAIQRNTKFGLDYNKNDFIFVKNGSTTELVNIGGDEYRAKIENGSFLKFIYDGTSWTVYDKDGKVYYYGSDASLNSKQESYDPKTNSYMGIFKWCLDRVEDSNGNYMTIDYQQDQGEIYLSKISYTGNSKTSLDPTNTIEFIRESRTDAPVSYYSHSIVKRAERLKTIIIKASEENARKYELEYDANPVNHYSASTGRSLLTKIEKYGYDALNVQWVKWPNDTTFTWNQVALDDQGQPQYGVTDHAYTNTQRLRECDKDGKPQMADINGDGNPDLVYEGTDHNFHVLFSNSNGFEPDSPNGLATPYDMRDSFKLGDVNGDGKVDIVYGDHNNNYHVLFSTGNGFEPDTPNGLVRRLVNYGVVNGWRVMDFNGDGKADIVYSDRYAIHHVLLSTGKDFTSDTVSGCISNIPYSRSEHYNIYYSRISDFNNDGRPDLLFHHSQDKKIFVTLNTGNTTTCFSEIDWKKEIGKWGERLHSLHFPQLHDVNGDGLPDFVFEGEDRKIRVLLNYGSGFTEDNDDAIWGTLDENYRAESGGPRLVNINGTGLPGIVYEHRKSQYVMLNASTGFQLEKLWGTRTNNYRDSNSGLKVVDINGDGILDLMYEDKDKVHHELKSQTPFPDLINTINDFNGATYTIVYKPSSGPLMPFVIQTVSSITTNDGISDTSITTSYEYSDGYYDYSSREFRGFGYAKQINPDNTTLETWFHQRDVKDENGNYTDDADFKSKPYRTEFKDSSNSLLSSTDIVWARSTTKNSTNAYPVFVKVNENTNNDYIGGVETYKRVVNAYNDNNGNLERIEKSGTGTEDVTTTNTYWQSPNKWLWRLESTTLTGSSTGQARKTTFGYESETGNLLTIEYWLKDGTNPETTFTYTAEGNLETQTDSEHYTTTTLYDLYTKTFPWKVINHLSHTIRYEDYDYRYGNPRNVFDINDNKSHIDFDQFGRTTAVTSYDKSSTDIVAKTRIDYYDEAFPKYIKTSVLENIDNGNELYINRYDFFDGFRRKIQTISSGEGGKYIVTQTHYDNMGRVDLTKGPFFSNSTSKDFLPAEYAEVFPCTANTYPCTQTTYYDFGKPHTVTSTDEEHTTITSTMDYTGDSNGLSTKVTDPDLKSMQETKDYLGRIIQVVEYADEGEQNTIYTYNAAGDMQSVTNHFGNQTIIKTDKLGRKKIMNDPDMGFWQYCYDGNGNLKKQIDADGNIIDFEYDELDRVSSKTYSKTAPPAITDEPSCTATGTASDNTVTYTYDTASVNGKGRLYQATNINVTTKYDSYDAMGRVKSETRTIDGDLISYTTGYDYDLSGKPTIITYPAGSPVGQVENIYYPGIGLLNQVKVDGTTYVTNSEYNPYGVVGKIDYSNSISTTYSYDPRSMKLTGIKTGKSSPGDIINKGYGYTKAGDIQAITDSKASIVYSYDYDNLHRLTGETSTNNAYDPLDFLYDAIGNIKTKTDGAVSYDYIYDDNKIHTLKNLIVDGQAYNLGYNQRDVVYNAELMPRQINMLKADNTSQIIDLMYDPDNTRAKKTGPLGTTYYIGGHLEKINGELTAYVFDGGLRIAKVTATKKYFFHKDHLGSTLAMTDLNGDVKANINYTPYGEEREHIGLTLSNYKFTDQEYDPETGLYNYRARLYDPVIGRFISPDTIVPDYSDPQSLNRYSYVRNNPLKYTDPSGHLTVHIWKFTGTGPNDAWGHTSMTLDNGTHISWWPNKGQLLNTNPIINQIYEARAYDKQTFDDDIRNEYNHQPDYQIKINGLNERDIQKWWDAFKENETWRTLFQNCSTTVSDGLKAGGAAVSWTDFLTKYNLVWTPSDVHAFATAIKNYLFSVQESMELPIETASPVQPPLAPAESINQLVPPESLTQELFQLNDFE